MEDVTARIREIIEKKCLTNAAFADAIDLKRPIVSHILSGRNKPSLHVVIQILKTYRDVDPSWLLLGKVASSTVVDTPYQETTKAVVPKPDEKAVSEPETSTEDIPSTLMLIEGDEFRIVKRKA